MTTKKTYEEKVNIRFVVPHELHQKVLKAQGLFTYKEGKKMNVRDVYVRLIERGFAEIAKQNRL